MSTEVQEIQQKIDAALGRIQQLEEIVANGSNLSLPPWEELLKEVCALREEVKKVTPPAPQPVQVNGNEQPPSRWSFLIARSHPWRRQLCIKGRNMTVGQMMSTIRANRYTPEQASENLELPLGAIYEAMAYYAENRGLIELEAAEERRWLAEQGIPLEPQDLPR